MYTIGFLSNIEKWLCSVLLFTGFILLTSEIVVAQEAAPGPQGAAAENASVAEVEEHLRLAISSPDYPVTPGDHYRLTYYQTVDTLITRDVLVDGDSTINLGVFGRIDAKGLTFMELKERVEGLIARSYTRSLPSLRILAPGVFRVPVTGEVDHFQYVTAWGLTRLSDIVNRARGRYSSLRTVEIQSRTGRATRYDLLKALRVGDMSQDPYAKPGDTIFLYPATRIVQLSGEVRHPGRYELLPNEGLRNLIEEFGGGITADADLSRIRIERRLVSRPHAEYVALPEAYGMHVDLANGDSVVVDSRVVLSLVVWFEGAVSTTMQPETGPPSAERQRTLSMGAEATGGGTNARSRVSCSITDGEMLSDVLEQIQKALLPSADLASATLRHEGSSTTIPVDLERLLSTADSSYDVVLRPNDTIFIPSLPDTVSVFGAVMNPGFFPYQPGLSPSYYLSMAGGIDPERNGNGKYRMTDRSGKQRKPSEPVMPGDRIYVPLNSFGYRFEHGAPLVVTILGAILNAATFIYLLSR